MAATTNKNENQSPPTQYSKTTVTRYPIRQVSRSPLERSHQSCQSSGRINGTEFNPWSSCQIKPPR